MCTPLFRAISAPSFLFMRGNFVTLPSNEPRIGHKSTQHTVAMLTTALIR
jgi:hypothetical protein